MAICRSHSGRANSTWIEFVWNSHRTKFHGEKIPRFTVFECWIMTGTRPGTLMWPAWCDKSIWLVRSWFICVIFPRSARKRSTLIQDGGTKYNVYVLPRYFIDWRLDRDTYVNFVEMLDEWMYFVLVQKYLHMCHFFSYKEFSSRINVLLFILVYLIWCK